MKIVIFGATGMVGSGVLLECLDDPRIEGVLLVSRHPTDLTHPKIREIVHRNFFDLAGIQAQFVDLDACFFCLGVSSESRPSPRPTSPKRRTTTNRASRGAYEQHPQCGENNCHSAL
jgi:nucleoside-diphosphate-sugar epimerase